jgi:iron complex outermembrane receptor protein
MVVKLPEITVEAARATETAASAPFSVSALRRSTAERTLIPSLSLDDVLRPLPGVWINDRHHLALGERVSVRGMGYRSNFGVRGVQILLDGVPLTLPDGQAFLDVVDPAIVRRAELIRNPAAVFWGNGSGGVLYLSTRPQDWTSTTRVRLQGGAFGVGQGLLESYGSVGAWKVHGYASGFRQDGYRSHSTGYRLRGGLNLQRTFDRTQLRITAAADHQNTENPSSLTQEQFRADPTQARPAFVEVDAGKQSEQAQIGWSLDHDLGGVTLSATSYYLYRSLENPLSFAYITYDRHSGGGRVTVRRSTGPLQGGVGVDLGVQRDDRVEFAETIDGEPGDTKSLSQVETVIGGAAFGYLRYQIVPRLALTGGLRLDGLWFSAKDRLTRDGLQSGVRTFSAWSPAIGVSFDLGPALLFAQYSTAFETPTASELSNRPEGGGGFNQQIRPQRSRGLEVGARGALSSANLTFDLALYRLQIENLISSRRLASGYQFYRNLGSNTHSGLEASLTWRPAPPLEIAARYTGNQFTINVPDTLDGNRVPGIPDHRGYAHVQAERSGFWSRVSMEAVPSFPVNNANTVEAPGYALVNLRVGHRGVPLGSTTIRPFASVDNLLDQRYAGSVVVNAFGGRYFEPAPGRSWTVGVNLSF